MGGGWGEGVCPAHPHQWAPGLAPYAWTSTRTCTCTCTLMHARSLIQKVAQWESVLIRFIKRYFSVNLSLFYPDNMDEPYRKTLFIDSWPETANFVGLVKPNWRLSNSWSQVLQCLWCTLSHCFNSSALMLFSDFITPCILRNGGDGVFLSVFEDGGRGIKVDKSQRTLLTWSWKGVNNFWEVFDLAKVSLQFFTGCLLFLS